MNIELTKTEAEMKELRVMNFKKFLLNKKKKKKMKRKRRRPNK